MESVAHKDSTQKQVEQNVVEAKNAQPRKQDNSRVIAGRSDRPARFNEPIRVKTEEIKIEPQRVRPSEHNGQRPDIAEHAVKSQLRDRGNTITVLAAKSADRENSQRITGSGFGEDITNRWHSLRSRLSRHTGAEASINHDLTQSSDSRHERSGLAGRNEDRGRVFVGRDNNIVMERERSFERPRPIISNHLIHDIQPLRNDHRWESHGSWLASRWSDHSCGRVILTPYHHRYGISFYYPIYHRRYIFVSLGGYWPYSYRYQRYYWYGCHPYYWYGADIVTEPTTVVYNNYTTYNYTTPATVTTQAVAAQPALAGGINTDTDIADAPLPQTQADICFANAVNAFGEGRYDEAAGLFRDAVRLSPDDDILPFTYCQAVFASGNYALAANILREAMARVPANEPAVYFPRGLYKDDQILKAQIAGLENVIAAEPFSTDYQLLLGYQYLGLGELDKVFNAFNEAAKNPANADAAGKLLDIAARMEKNQQDAAVENQS